MATREFKLPDLGEGLTESEVVEWRVAVGDAVELNQVIAEVETAKALVELPSPCAGIVRVLHAEEGQTVEVGEPLVTFDLSDGTPVEPVETTDRVPTLRQAQDGAGSTSEDGPEPNLVGYGARPARTGRPARRRRRAAPVPSVEPVETRVSTAPTDGEASDRPRSTPVVRAMARQRGIDLATITGSGPHGRITRDDVEAASSGATTSPTTPAPATSATSGEERTPVRGVRRRTAAAMVASAAAPQASVFLTVDVTASMGLLARLKTHPMAGGQRITVLALTARALLALLPKHPALTSRWVDLADGEAEIVRPAHVNLGIAVATDRGLVVPHVPAADTLSLTGLAAALTDLTTTARAGRTTPERLRNGTLTITNVGIFGVDAGTPILNPGEPAILGLGQVARRPWEHDGEVALRQVTTLSLTFDHRVVDGEQGARFLAELGAVLADPALALLLPSVEPVEPVEATGARVSTSSTGGVEGA
ncbi:dihydrolipoamide acetyltransferase family protein [Krasilnikoviella flava]|uniref:Dihydrolipoamide acetyltransferase component of pyruvate dehydrogenase complex n=1 Tax=Krasilnikoviella flava TaxID=526729 RepID=A0A1T5J4M3_9MICO|nr:dihydrolipoamide acetyltransferase family protein [Krasilnikoviella flava]SKC46148.1 pyruvate dehydrogenase E2 component (dihydrolipoamide acetyltransferase) [Krasilnikoviella flava]